MFLQNGYHGNMIQAIFKFSTSKSENLKVISSEKKEINLKKIIKKEHDLWLNPQFP